MTRWIALAVALGVAAFAVMAAGCKKTDEPSSTTAAPAPSMSAESTEATEPTDDSSGDYTYVCPMHPDETSDKPAKCGVCGMFLEADTDEEVEYYCPMHEDVVQGKPGGCDACGGMILPARPKS